MLLLLSSLLLRFLLLPSVSCSAFSTRVLSAPATAAVFCTSILVSCASFLFLAAAFFYCDDNFLISFFEFRFFTVVFFGFIFLFSIHSLLVLCVSFPDVVLSLRHVDQESSHNTSMVTSHVDHVVGLSVFHILQVSSLGQYGRVLETSLEVEHVDKLHVDWAKGGTSLNNLLNRKLC